tara:strand:- start:3386 stop:4303 length:918 start_codon:yes stop_codon:yes gene_type:complete
MNAQPLVSIIMNCHNGDRFLKEAIDSVYAQFYENWEIIFWDNVSTDKSSSIVSLYDQKIKYFLANEKTSLGEARNLALKKVSGKYICFLDCDDIYLPNKLEKQVAIMEENNYPLAYGSAIFIDEKNKKVRNFKAKNNSGLNFKNLLNYYEICMQSVILRKSYLVNNNLNFQTNFQYCPDYNLFMRISAEKEIGVEKEHIVKYRIVSDSLSSKTFSLAGPEVRLTLDEISKGFPELLVKFKRQFDQAYAKSNYYDVVASIYEGDYDGAKKQLQPLVFLRYEYLGLYILLLIHFPKRLILRLINRHV